MKRLAALVLLLASAGCAPSNTSNSTPQGPNDGVVQQENRTALSLFYGDYVTIAQNGDAISATLTGEQTLTCSTDATIGNAVASHPVSGATNGSTYDMGVFTDASGALVKSDEIWIAPGVLLFDNHPACTDYHMSVFADRGRWRMGTDFIEYHFQGTLKRNGEDVTFDDSLRVDRLEDGTVQVQIDSKTSDGDLAGTWLLQPKSDLH